MRTRITRRAWQDLDEIGEWVAANDPRAAERLISRLLTRVKAIGERPLSFPALQRPDGVELRKRSVRPYVIIFRVADEVAILRIVHTRRDYLSMLDDQ